MGTVKLVPAIKPITIRIVTQGIPAACTREDAIDNPLTDAGIADSLRKGHQAEQADNGRCGERFLIVLDGHQVHARQHHQEQTGDGNRHRHRAGKPAGPASFMPTASIMLKTTAMVTTWAVPLDTNTEINADIQSAAETILAELPFPLR